MAERLGRAFVTTKTRSASVGAFLLSPVFFTDAYSLWRKIAYGALQVFLIFMSQSRGAWGYTIGMILFIGWMHLLRRVRGRELTLMIVFSSMAMFAVGVSIVYFWPAINAATG